MNTNFMFPSPQTTKKFSNVNNSPFPNSFPNFNTDWMIPEKTGHKLA